MKWIKNLDHVKEMGFASMNALENGDLIQAVLLDKSFLSVDNIEHLEEVKKILKENKLQKEILKKIK